MSVFNVVIRLKVSLEVLYVKRASTGKKIVNV